MQVYIYKVRENDTLEKIARYYDVTPKQIFPQTFEVGDRVVVKKQNTKCYIVLPGDTLEKIAGKLDMPIEMLKEKNIEPLFVGKHIVI